jgi:hypothetical protein
MKKNVVTAYSVVGVATVVEKAWYHVTTRYPARESHVKLLIAPLVGLPTLLRGLLARQVSRQLSMYLNRISRKDRLIAMLYTTKRSLH